MKEILIQKLYDYIGENNPDLLLTLQQENRLTEYLHKNVESLTELIDKLVSENKPAFVVEECCMEELTRQLRPSRFHYLKNILEKEFFGDFERLQQSDLLTIELINMIAACDPVFDKLNFSEETEDNRNLRYAIMGAVHEYLTSPLITIQRKEA